MREILSVAAMRAADAATILSGVSGRELMDRAAQGVFDAVAWRGPAAIVCGSGNNGGDGYALALRLHGAGIPCRLLRLDGRFSETGRYFYDQCMALGIPDGRCGPDTDFSGDVHIVDCLFGTGFRGPARGLAAALIGKMNAAGAEVISVDINSGLGGDSGLGDPVVRSALTVSIGSPQPGHYLNMAKDVIGRLASVDIGILPPARPYYLTEAADFAKLLAPRKNYGNKGDYGYVALLGGCIQYGGAAKLSNLSLSALRCGCGVATLAVPASLASAVAPYLLESTLAPMPDRDGYMIYDPAPLEALLMRRAALGMGMGWGQGPDNQAILRHVLAHYDGVLVLDADGLNTLAAIDPPPESIRPKLVLTPHVKEFSRLSGWSRDEILTDPVGRAREYAARRGLILLLKGPATVVTDGDATLLTDRGCAGMATAGSGDVLTGILTGLLGWADYGPLAVACGAYLAGLAGEYAQAAVGDIAMTAGDTVNWLPRAIREMRE